MSSAEPTSKRRSDLDIMEAIAFGDESAFRELYDRYASFVLAVCVRMLGDRDDAEDLLTEIYWELWRKSDRYHPSRSSPRTYIMRLTHSRAIDRLRARKAGAAALTRRTAPDDEVNQVVSTSTPALNRMIDREQWAVVVDAVRQLDASQREAIELAYFDDLSHRQIADRLQVPLGTIKSRIRQGLIFLRDRLKQIYMESDPVGL